MTPPNWFKRLSIPIANQVVYASNAYVGLKSTVNQMGSQLIKFTELPGGPADERLLEVLKLIRPVTADNLRLVRIGGEHDGGYVMAAPLKAVGALSIGVGPDVSWDIAVATAGIPVSMFDPTIPRPPKKVRGATFHRIGLGRSNNSHYRSLDSLLSLCDFPPEGDLIMKVDIEGDEWSGLLTDNVHTLKRFSQLAIEFHGFRNLSDPHHYDRAMELLKLLTQHHLPISIHANNFAQLIRFDSYWFVDAVEVTYCRRDHLTNPSPTLVISNEFSRPCDPRVSEISLSGLSGVSAGYSH